MIICDKKQRVWNLFCYPISAPASPVWFLCIAMYNYALTIEISKQQFVGGRYTKQTQTNLPASYCRTSSCITLDSHANASAFHGVSIVHERGLVTFSAVFNDISLIMRNASIEIVIYMYTVSQKNRTPYLCTD